MSSNPLTWWSGPENIAWVKIDSESSWALLDSGLTINAVTPGFIEANSLDIGPLSDLANGTLGINGYGGVFSWPLGYAIIRVQVEEIWGYDKDQVALVVPDYHFWFPSTSYAGYTHHQLDHQHYQRK